MTSTRAAIAHATLLGLALFCAGAVAPPITLKLASVAPAGSSWDAALRDMAAAWRQASAGRVTLTVVRVGDDEIALVRKLRSNAIDSVTLSTVGLTSLDPAFNIFAIPLFYGSSEELSAVQDALTPVIKARLAARKLVLLHAGVAGWIQIFSKKPVRTPAELKHLTIGVLPGIDNRVLEWYGANGFHTEVVALADVVPALQSGRIDAVPATPLVAAVLEWYRPASHMLQINFAPLIVATVMTQETWDTIPVADRPALMAAAARAGREIRSGVSTQDRKSVADMQARGLTVSAVDTGPSTEWRAVADGFASSMRGIVVPADVYDSAVSARAVFRKR